jgi:hypothetical protein
MPRLLSQRKKVTPVGNLTDERYQYLNVQDAQPALGLAPTLNEGYTLKTDGQGKASFSNTLGKLSFANSTITNTQAADIAIDNRGNGNIILSPSTQVLINGKADIKGDTLIEGNIKVTGDNPLGTFPVLSNTLYVNEDGDDANDGRAMDASRAKRTITGATRSPYYQEGTTIKVAAGHYWEDNPIALKPSTAVIGDDLRTTFIEPLNKEVDLFWVNSGVYIAQLAMLNLKKGSVERYAPGGAGTYTTGAYACAFPPKLTDPILVQYSPYIQNCTNQSGPWLFDGTMFRPNQTVQVPLGAGVSTWLTGASTITVAMSTGSVAVGMAINDLEYSGYANAQQLLLDNIPFLQAEALAYIASQYPTFVYNTSTCARDIGLIINAVASDARFGGNLRSRDAGASYWNGTYSIINGEQAQTVAAINYISSLAQQIVVNQVNTVTYQSAVTQTIEPMLTGGGIVLSNLINSFNVISNVVANGLSALPAPQDMYYGLITPSGISSDDITRATTVTNITSTSTGLANAQTLLKANRTFIQSEVVAWVGQTYPGFVYNTATCFRDVGLILDAISIDGIIGGNIQSSIAGLSYYTGVTSNIPGEITQTVGAINYINALSQQIITNTTATRYTTSTQYINPALTGGSSASVGIANSVNVINNIILNGPTAAPAKKYPSLDQYVVTLSSPAVSFGTSSTIYFGYTTVYPVEDKNIPQYWLSQRALNPKGSGGGALVDGNAPSEKSPIQSFVFDAFTQLNQGGIGVHVINNGYAQLVSVFTIFCDIGVLTENGGICSITNSNANFGNFALVSKGLGRLDFSGIVWNPPNPTNVPNGEFYPLGYWPQKGNVEVFIPDAVSRPHIGLTMEVVPPKTFIDYTGNRIPYLNSQGYPGFLAATPNTSTITAGAYTIENISTDGIAIGHTLYITDITSATDVDGVPYVSTGTTVVDVNFNSVTLDQPINVTAGEPTNDLYFNLYFCGNSYYNVLSSRVDPTVSQPQTTTFIPGEIDETASAIRHARDLVGQVITNTTVTNLYQTTATQYFNPAWTNGGNGKVLFDNKFNIIADIIQYGQLTAPTIVKNSQIKNSDQGVLNAAKLIDANKTFIQSEIVNFVNQEFVGFKYDQAKCYRDTGLIVDSIAFDLLYGGYTQSTFAGLQYYNQSGYTGSIASEITTTTNAIKYASSLTLQVIQGITTGTRYQSTVTQNTGTSLGLTATIFAVTGTQFIDAGTGTQIIYVNKNTWPLINSVNTTWYVSGTGMTGTNAVISTSTTGTSIAIRTVSSRTTATTGTSVYSFYNTDGQKLNYILSTVTNDYSIITGILSSGTTGVTDIIIPNSTASTYPHVINAYNIIEANKSYIQAEVVAWVKANTSSTFSFNTATCYRDIGYIVDSVAFDLLHKGNRQAVQSGVYYYGFSNTSTIRGQKIETQFAYNHISDIATSLLTGIPITTVYQTTVTQVTALPAATPTEASKVTEIINTITNIILNGTGTVTTIPGPCPLTPSSSTNIVNAYNMLMANRKFIQAETIAYTNAMFFNFNYDATKCARDTGLIIDSLAVDLLYNGSSQSNFAALQYWNQDGYTGQIDTEITTTTNAINYVSALAQKVIQNITTGTRYQSTVTQITGLPASNTATAVLIATDFNLIVNILNNGIDGITDQIVPNGAVNSDPNITNAYALLQANKSYIQAEAIAYVNATKTGGFQFDELLCYRDLGYILNGAYYDTALGTNYNGVYSGLAYQRGTTSSQNVLSNELSPTLFALNYAKTQLATSLASSATAVTSGTASIQKTIDIITLNTGTSTAVYFTVPTGLTNSSNQVIANKQLVNNKSFIQSEISAWLGVNYPTLNYTTATCTRDVGYIVDSLSYDILYGGTWATNISARSYYSLGSPVLPAREVAPSVAAYGRMSTVIQQIVQGQTVSKSSGNLATQNTSAGSASSSTAATLSNLVSIITATIGSTSTVVIPNAINPSISWASTATRTAVNQLATDIPKIQNFTVNYVKNQYSSLFSFNPDNCYRDTGLIVDSLAFDLLYGGTSQSTFAGLQYWSQTTNTNTVIPGEFTTTTNAITYLQSLLVPIIQSAADTTTANIVNTNLNTLINILSNGVVGVTDKIIPNGATITATNYVNAYNAIQTVKPTLINSVITYINNNNPTFVYDQTRCAKDLGYILDSTAFDLIHSGNRQSVMSGVYYYGYTTSTVLLNEMPETVAAYNYIKTVVGNVITGTPIVAPYQNFVTQVITTSTGTVNEVAIVNSDIGVITNIISNGPSVAGPKVPIGTTASSTASVINAFNLLNSNRAFIQAEVLSYVNYNFIGPNFDRTKCRRDTGLIIDALAQDLLFSGQSQSNFAALQYWNQNGYTGSIGSEVTTTTNTLNYLAQLATDVVQNITTGFRVEDFIQQITTLPSATAAEAKIISDNLLLVADIIQNGTAGVTDRIVPNNLVASTNTNIINAYNLLIANRVYFQAQAVAFVEDTKDSEFAYNQATCYRDVGYIINSVAFDLLYGGNRQSIQSGVAYYSYSSNFSAVDSEITQTTNAYNRIAEIIPYIVKNISVPTTYQSRYSQVFASTTGTTAEATAINTNISLITNVINNGPSVALERTPIGLTPSTTATVVAAATLLELNKNFITEEVISYVNTTMGGFQYDQNKCYRDVGYMIDSVSFDILHGGNRQAIQSGVYYYDFNGNSTTIPNEIPQTTAAYKFIGNIISKIITASTITNTYQTGTVQVTALPVPTNTSTAVASFNANINLITSVINNGPTAAYDPIPVGLSQSSDANVVKAYNLLTANRAFIVAEVIAYIDSTFVTFNYDQNKCYRDVNSIIDAVVYDVLYGGNYRSVNTGNGYYSRQGRYHVLNLEQNVTDPTQFIDGITVNFYQTSYQSASGYLFEYIGSGPNYSALPQIGRKDPIQSHETVQLSNGKVFFTSTDQNGDFRIGPGLVISQATGVLSGRTFQKSLYAEMTPFVLVIGA